MCKLSQINGAVSCKRSVYGTTEQQITSWELGAGGGWASNAVLLQGGAKCCWFLLFRCHLTGMMNIGQESSLKIQYR